MNKCLICRTPFTPFFDFGEMPIANSFSPIGVTPDTYRFLMKIGICNNCKMVQLTEQPDPERMFHENYAFYSSTSKAMQKHFKDFASEILARQRLGKNSFVVEIGCNDGVMLKNFNSAGVPCLGVEPSKNVAEVAHGMGLNVITEFFDEKLSNSIEKEFGKADAILSANVICHIPNLAEIFTGVQSLLKENGIFVFEDPYAGDVLEKSSFDQIYDEHVFLFSAHSVSFLANLHGLTLFHVEPQVTHGGSMRYFICRKGHLDVNSSVDSLLEKEKSIGVDCRRAFENFGFKVDEIRKDLLSLLTRLKEEGKRVVAYGATSKSTTVTNYFNITPDLVEAIYDTTPIKHNTLSPGVLIPVLPYELFRDSEPDYVLLFAWNHADEIMEKEKKFMSGERRWITYIPSVKVV